MTYKLSPSRMNLFFECRRCFWLRVNQNVKRPSGPFPSLPSGVDDKMKDHFDRFRETDQSPPELQSLDLELLEDKDFLENARSWRTQPKLRFDNLDALLRGGVDDLLRDEDGEIVVMDYKTRGYPPKKKDGAPDYYRRQVNLYSLILSENGYRTADYGLILYFYPDKFTDEGDFVFNTEIREVDIDLGEARKMVEDAVETLDGEIPDHSEQCDFCEWKIDKH